VNAAGATTAPGGLTRADLWLSPTGGGKAQALVDYLRSHNGLRIITFDEAATSDLSGCCHGGPGGTAGIGGRVGLVAIGACVQPGRVIHTQYDHASLLRTVEDSFGIPEHLNNGAASSAMSELVVGCPTNFQQPTTSTAPNVTSNGMNTAGAPPPVILAARVLALALSGGLVLRQPQAR
jgi:hypothetical protein